MPPKPQASHLDEAGRARMVDVGDKPVTTRRAVAEGRVRVSGELAEAIHANRVAKGQLLEVARIAGIQAAKQTDRLIPLCHSVPLDVVHVEAWLKGEHVCLRAEAKTSWKTGVEMEALTAVMVAALTVIDMGKAIDPGMVVEDIRLVEKSGGVHGHHAAGPRSTDDAETRP